MAFPGSPSNGQIYVANNGAAFQYRSSTNAWLITGYTGIVGATGEQGIQGDTGLQGSQGDTGLEGGQGETGAIGETGLQGSQGDTGLQGSQGDTGLEGGQGETGLEGGQGETGLEGGQGETGLQGSQGDTGAQGIQGDTGLEGGQGETGAIGETGIQGSQGDTGLEGGQGETGVQGIQGATGEQGVQGDTGEQGVQGDTGVQGIQGDTGLQGGQGETGVQGYTGAQGSQGETGEQGTTGLDGLQGETGAGIQGETGEQGAASTVAGATGAQGFTGAQGSTGLQGSTGTAGAAGSVGTWTFWATVSGSTGTFARSADRSYLVNDASNSLTLEKRYSKGTCFQWGETGGTFQSMVWEATYTGLDGGAILIKTLGDVMNAGATGLKYAMEKARVVNFAAAGTLPSAATTNLAQEFYAPFDMKVFGADARVSTAGSTGTTVVDINDDATTMFTAKPTIAIAGTASTDNTADGKIVAVEDSKLTVDVDTNYSASNLWVTLYYTPNKNVFLP